MVQAVAMGVTWNLHYDRRVSEDFLSHFLSGGVAHSLVEYARYAPYAVDLQMRKDPKTGAEHATLYAGLTSVLDVKRNKDQLRLVPHKWASQGQYGFNMAWTKAMTVSTLATQWRGVEDYLDYILPEAAKKHASREGAVQAAASVFRSHDRIMFDREFALHFKDTATKKDIFTELTTPVLSAIQRIPGVPGQPPSSFGGECDLLALDATGRVLAVEVKPRGTGSIVWSGLQATVYARLLTRWIGTSPAEDSHGLKVDPPATILRGMLEQRARLGLAPTNRPDLPDRPIVVPVVALQRGWNVKYLDRLLKVQDAVLSSGCGDPTLEIYEVSMAGRMDRIR